MNDEEEREQAIKRFMEKGLTYQRAVAYWDHIGRVTHIK